MAEHLPLFAPGAAVTYNATASITAGQVVEVAGDRAVKPAAAGSLRVVGVAAFDASAGAKLTVESGGIHSLAASGEITAGQLVAAADDGAVAAAADTSTAIGIAIAAAADGTVLVKLA